MGMLLRRHRAADETPPETDTPDAPKAAKPSGRSRSKGTPAPADEADSDRG
ncbi:hypothetical protein [Yinghuangia soli]|uniref:Uncharacterized protein n=1 Tax=Yinghuangia soli TaxID=2908204 RepID=A0AA41Q5M4_9ACTN|nr:hypothetical protein [Yinghuangia soli]MCF2531746.1 hypothetical protein [Yinghuangia soli]